MFEGGTIAVVFLFCLTGAQKEIVGKRDLRILEQ